MIKAVVQKKGPLQARTIQGIRKKTPAHRAAHGRRLAAVAAITALACLAPLQSEAAYSGSGTFTLITAENQITAGGYYVFVGGSTSWRTAMGSYTPSYLLISTPYGTASASTTIVNPPTTNVWRIDGNSTAWNIYQEPGGYYIGHSAANNAVSTSASTSLRYSWTFATTVSSAFSIRNKESTERVLQYNASSPRFATYSTAQVPIRLYKLGETTGDIWINPMSAGTPAATYYLGDTMGTWYYNFEIGQTSWNDAKVGIGTSTAGTGYNWATANWYEDGSGSNKRVRRDLSGYQYTATGSHYVICQARAGTGTYVSKSGNGWGNYTTYPPTDLASAYFTCSALNNPGSQTATAASQTQINLGWAKDAQGHDVMIVRSTDASFTAPTGGTTYTPGSSTIGGDLVIYRGGATSYNDTGLSAGTTYYYKFYSENWSYYSDGVTASATTVAATPDIALANNGTQIAAANVAANTASHVLHKFQLTVSTATATLTAVAVPAGGTYASADVTYLKLWYSTDSTFGGDTAISTLTTPGTAGIKTFSSLSQSLPVGTHYFFVTADIAATPTAGNTIWVGPLTNSTALTFSSGNKSGGPTTAGGAQTIITLPTLTSPTATAIGQTTATLGANVTSLGGTTISARGTVWGTATNPTGNAVAQGGTTTGVFTHDRTSLNQGTKIFYRGYAVNSVGTAYSSHGTFYTEPGQASTVVIDNVTPTGMRISWTAGENASGAIVVMRASNSAITDPTDGTLHSASATFGSGADLGSGSYVVYRDTGTSVTVGNLTAGTTYYVEVFAFAGTVATSGVDQGINYRQTSPATGSAAACPPAPTGTTTPTTNDTSFVASWTAANGATGYKIDVSTSQTFSVSGGSGGGVIISKMCDPANNEGSDSFIQIYNTSGSSISLTGWSVVTVENGSDAETINLSGSIASGESLAIGDTASTVSGSLDFTGDYFQTSDPWNGGANDGCKLYNGATLVDNVVSSSADYFKDSALVRASTVQNPNTTFTASEWSMESVTDVSSSGGGANDVTAFTSSYPAGTPDYVNAYSNRTVAAGTSETVTGLTSLVTYYWRVRTTGANCDSVNSSTVTVTTVASVPTITLANNDAGQTGAGTVVAGTATKVLSTFKVTIETLATTLNQVQISTVGSYVSGDLTNLKLWYSTDNGFNSGSDSMIKELTTPGAAGSKTFSSLTQNLAIGSHWFFVTADIASGATGGNQINIAAMAESAISVSSGTPSGSASAAGTQTILTVPVLTTPTATSIGTNTATLGATVTSLGGEAALSSRGTVYNITGSPVTENALAAGGTTVGAFSHARSPLSRGMKYYYRGYAVNSVGTAYSPQGSFYTEPRGPNGWSFYPLSQSSLRVSWSGAQSNDGVIVVMRQGSAVANFPQDGTVYTANSVFGTPGAALGSGYVVYAGAASYVDVTGLSPVTEYHVHIMAYKGTVATSGNDQGINYREAEARTSSTTTLSTPPTVNASGLLFSGFLTNGATLSWTRGNGDGVVVAVGSNDSDYDAGGTPYADPVWGGGDEIDGGWFCVYNGVGTTVNVTGLDPATTYWAKVWEYKGSGGTENYKTDDEPFESFTTVALEPTTQATGLSFTSVGTDQMTVNWTGGNGASNLVVVRAGGAVSWTPTDGVAPAGVNANYSMGTDLGSGNKLCYSGNGSSFTLTGLESETTYYVKIFEYNGAGATVNYLTSGTPLSGSQVTATPTCVPNEVVLVQQTDYYTSWQVNGGTFNYGTTNMGIWAHGATPQAAAWRTFKTSGSTGGTARELQPGDRFRITVRGYSPFGILGASLNDGAATGSWANRHSNTRGYIQCGNQYGDLYVTYGTAGGDALSWSTIRPWNTAVTLEYHVLSSKEFTANIVGQTPKYDLTMIGSPGDSDRIDGYSVYYENDWNGTANVDAYWAQETAVTNLGYVEFGADGGTRTINGKITDGTNPKCPDTASPNYLKKSGSGEITLNHSSSTYTLYTEIAGGTLKIAADGCLGTAPAGTSAQHLRLAGGAALVFTDNFTLNANRGITLQGNNPFLAVADNKVVTYDGIITDGSSTCGLIKNQGGELVLGGASTYDGATYIDNGTVTVSNAAALGTTGGIDLGQGSGTPTYGATLKLALAGMTLANTPLTVKDNSSGIKTILAAENATFSGAIAIDESSDDQFSIDVASGKLLTLSGVMSVNTSGGKITKTGAGTVVLANALNSHSKKIQINEGTVSISASRNLGEDPAGTYANKLTLNGGTLKATASFTMHVNNSTTLGANNGFIEVDPGVTLTYPAAISGSGAFAKTGTGILKLTGGNSFSGPVTNSAGTLQIGDNGTAGSLTAGITNNATLIWHRSDDVSYGGVIAGTGTLEKKGAGTLTMSGAHSYTGATTITEGTLKVSNSGGLGTAAGGTTVASGAALEFSGHMQTYADALVLNGSGPAGKGALTNAASMQNTVSGAITLNSAATIGVQGILNLNGEISGAQALTLAVAGTCNINSVIGNVASINKTGSGTLDLKSGQTHTFSGTATVSEGTMINNALASSMAVSVASGATLVGTGTNAAVSVTGTVDPGATAGAVGKLTGSSLTLNAGGVLRVDVSNVSGTPGAQWDLFTASGNVSVGGAATLALYGNPTGWDSTAGYSWLVIDGGGSTTGEGSLTVNTNNFTAPTDGGVFSVVKSGVDLYCVFTPRRPAMPVAFDAAAASVSSMTLTFTRNAQSDDVIIVWDSDGTFDVPTGTAPAVGAGFAGGTVLYKGPTSPQPHSSLSSCTPYYYKVWSYKGTNYSETGLTDNDTTATPAAPASVWASATNETDFTASWSAATGASGYRLDVSTYSDFLAPGGASTNCYHNGTLGEGTGGTWTETGLTQGSGYLVSLTGDSLITPAMDFTVSTAETLTFMARTYGGVGSPTNDITVSISTNNGSTWTSLGTRTPSSATLTAMTPFDLSSYNFSQVKVKFETLSASASIGAGLDDVLVTNLLSGVPSYVVGYSNLFVSGTSQQVTGLTGGQMYYFRVRAEGNNGACVSANSTTASVLTIANSTIALADNGTQVAAADVLGGATALILHKFQLTIGTAATTLTGVNFTTPNGYAAGDITKFQVWYSTDNTLNTGTDTQLGADITSSLGPGSHGVSGLSQVLGVVSAHYIFITADVAASPTLCNTLAVNAITTDNLTFSAGNKSGSTAAGGAQTFIASEPTAHSTSLTFTSIGATSLTVGWTLPSPAPAGVLVVVKQGASTTWTPTDKTLASGINANFTSATDQGSTGNKVCYSGSGSSFVLSGLSASTTYAVTVFEYNGTGSCLNYYTGGTPLAGSQATACLDLPTGLYASFTNLTSFTSAWTAVSAATGYLLDVSTVEDFGGSGGGNLMVNGGFETGDFTDWDTHETEYSVVSTDPQEGTYHVSCPATATRKLMQQVAITGDGVTEYEVSYYYKVLDGDGSDVRIWSTWGSGGQVSGDVLTSATYNATTADWTKKTYHVVPASGANTLDFEVRVYSGATVYLDNFYVGTGGSGGDFVSGYQALPVSDTSQLVSGLTWGETYYFRVRATNATCTGNLSATATVTLPTPPPNPSLANATVDGNTLVRLSWSKHVSYDVMIVYKEGSASTEPTQGQAYSAGGACGGGTVIYKGSASTLDHMVNVGQAHYYAFYSYTADNLYSSGLTDTEWTGTFGAGEIVDTFSYTNGTQLAAHGNGSNNWASAWAGDTTLFTNANGSFSAWANYPEPTGNKLFTSPAGGAVNDVNRTNTAWFETIVYASFIMNHKWGGHSSGQEKWCGAVLMDNNTDRVFFGESGGGDQVLGLAGGTYSGTSITAGDGNDYIFIVKYDIANDDAWACAYKIGSSGNEVPTSEPGTWHAEYLNVHGGIGKWINGIKLVSGGYGSATPGDTFFDEVRMGSSWGAVVITDSTPPILPASPPMAGEWFQVQAGGQFIAPETGSGTTNVHYRVPDNVFGEVGDAGRSGNPQNPGFDGGFTGWSRTTGNNIAEWHATAGALAGGSSGGLLFNAWDNTTDAFGEFLQDVAATSGAQIVFSALMRQDQNFECENFFGLALQFVNESGNLIDFGGNAGGTMQRSGTGVNTTTQRISVAATAPANTDRVRILVQMKGPPGPGTGGSITPLDNPGFDGAAGSTINGWTRQSDSGSIAWGDGNAGANAGGSGAGLKFDAYTANGYGGFYQDAACQGDETVTFSVRMRQNVTFNTDFFGTQIQFLDINNNVIGPTTYSSTDGVTTQSKYIPVSHQAPPTAVKVRCIIRMEKSPGGSDLFGFADDATLSGATTEGGGVSRFGYVDNVQLEGAGEKGTGEAVLGLFVSAYDPETGLTRGKTDNSKQTNIDVTNALHAWKWDDVGGYEATWSSVETKSSGSTSAWKWALGDVDFATLLTDNYDNQALGADYAADGRVFATNRVTVSLANGMSLWTVNQQYGFVSIQDDDVQAPSPTLLYVGTNVLLDTYSDANRKITVTDEEMLGGGVDFAYSWYDPSGIFLTNVNPSLDPSVFEQWDSPAQGYPKLNVWPNYDLTNATYGKLQGDHFHDRSHMLGQNGDQIVTCRVVNLEIPGLTKAKIPLHEDWTLTVSAQDTDNDRGSFTNTADDADVSQDRTLAINVPLTFSILDDDLDAPVVSAANVSQKTDGNMRAGNWNLTVPVQDAKSGIAKGTANSFWDIQPQVSLYSPDDYPVLLNQVFANVGEIVSGTSGKAAAFNLSITVPEVPYANVVTGLHTVAVTVQDYDDDRYNADLSQSIDRELALNASAGTINVIDDDNLEPEILELTVDGVGGSGTSNLIAGAIAVIGVNGYSAEDTDNVLTTHEKITFVVLAPFPEGTTLWFTDCGWNAYTDTNWWDTNEFHLTSWTATGPGDIGTVVTRPLHLINSGGDQVALYQYKGTGDPKTDPTNCTFIYAINIDGTKAGYPGWYNAAPPTNPDNEFSGLYRGLTEGWSAVSVTSSTVNVYYSGGTTGTASWLLQQISTPTNWTTNLPTFTDYDFASMIPPFKVTGQGFMNWTVPDISDQQMNDGGYVVTNIAMDIGAGLVATNITCGDGHVSSKPYYVLYNTNGVVAVSNTFPTTYANGYNAGPVTNVVTALGGNYDTITLGLVDFQVVVADTDDDRPGDTLYSTNILQVQVYDDDLDAPSVAFTNIQGRGSSDYTGGNTEILYYEFGLTNEPTLQPTRIGIAVSSVADVTVNNGTISYPIGKDGSPDAAISSTSWTNTIPAYWQFQVTMQPGFSLDMQSIALDYQRSSTGPTSWSLRSSKDSFANDLAYGDLSGTSYQTLAASLTSSSNSGTITYRLYGSNAVANGGAWRIDNVTFTGKVYATGASYVATDSDLNTNGVVYWARVQDSYSGVCGLEHATRYPSWDLVSPAGTASNLLRFGKGPANEGAKALTTMVTTNGFGYDDIVLGIYTTRVRVADFDDDRSGDTLYATNEVTLTVVDDDAAAPYFSVKRGSYLTFDGVNGNSTEVTDGMLTNGLTISNRLYDVKSGVLENSVQFRIQSPDGWDSDRVAFSIRPPNGGSRTNQFSDPGTTTVFIADYDVKLTNLVNGVDGRSLGTWTSYFYAADYDNDRLEDSLTATQRFTVAVIDDDKTGPRMTNVTATGVAKAALIATGFEPLDGWISYGTTNQTHTAFDGDWVLTDSYINTTDGRGPEGINAGYHGGLNKDKVGTSSLQLPAVNQPGWLTVWAKLSGAGESKWVLERNVSGTWTSLGEKSVLSTDYTMQSWLVDSTANGVQLRLRMTATITGSRSIFFDDLVVTPYRPWTNVAINVSWTQSTDVPTENSGLKEYRVVPASLTNVPPTSNTNGDSLATAQTTSFTPSKEVQGTVTGYVFAVDADEDRGDRDRAAGIAIPTIARLDITPPTVVTNLAASNDNVDDPSTQFDLGWTGTGVGPDDLNHANLPTAYTSDMLSPWQTYKLYFKPWDPLDQTEGLNGTNYIMQKFINNYDYRTNPVWRSVCNTNIIADLSANTNYNALATAGSSSIRLCDLEPGEDYVVVIVGLDRAGNENDAGVTSWATNDTIKFIVTSAWTVAKSVAYQSFSNINLVTLTNVPAASNATALAWLAAGQKNGTGTVTKVYDLIYWDASRFQETNTAPWRLADNVQSNWFVDDGGMLKNRGAIRFYRASYKDRWRNVNTNTMLPQRPLASEEVYAQHNIVLARDQNFVALHGVPWTNTFRAVFGGTNAFPGGNTASPASGSTIVEFYQPLTTNNDYRTVVNEEYWLSSQGRWSQVNGSDVTDVQQVPGFFSRGFSITLPDLSDPVLSNLYVTTTAVDSYLIDPNTGKPTVLPAMVWSPVLQVPTNNTGFAQVIQCGNQDGRVITDVYNVVALRLPVFAHPSEMNLIGSGFVKGPRGQSDEIYTMDTTKKDTRDGSTIYCDPDGTWRYFKSNGLVSGTFFRPNDVIIIVSRNQVGNGTWTWTYSPTTFYRLPDKWMGY